MDLFQPPVASHQSPPSEARAHAAFLTHMRHELRTPINAIIGYAELILDEVSCPGLEGDAWQMAEDLTRIRRAGRELAALVDEILSPHKVEATEEIDPLRFAADIRHALRTPITAVVGYAEMLLEDATERQELACAADLGRILAAGTRLLDDLQDIIEVTRVAMGRQSIDATRMVSGAHAIEALDSIAPLERNVERRPLARGGRLLIIDDNELDSHLLRRRLEKAGHTVCTAPSGTEGLALLARERFDLLLVDIVMPGMNGYQVLDRLKGDPLTEALPVIMLSSLDEVDVAVRCIQRGADDYLGRPINPVLVNARIEACLEKKRLREREHEHLAQLEREQQKSESLLLNVLPAEVAERLKSGDGVIADKYSEATVIFADLVDFTELSSQVTASQLVDMLNAIFSSFDRLADTHGVEKIKTIGDEYMAAGGVPCPMDGHAAAVARMGLGMVREVARLSEVLGHPLRVRVGINSGPVVAGVIGKRKFIYDLWGDTVNIASRMESTGLPGRVHISPRTRALLGPEFDLEARPPMAIKGKGQMQTYLLRGLELRDG